MKKCMIAILIIAVMSGTVLFSATLDKVLEKNYAARGGLEKLKAVKTTKILGKGIRQGMEFPISMIMKRPNKMRVEVEVMGKKIIQCYNGKKAWWIMPLMGIEEPTEMPEEQAKDTIEQAELMDPLVDYKAAGHKLELLGKEDMEGTEVYKLKLTRKDNKKELFFFLDVESGITIKSSAYRKRAGNEVLVETYYGDYKEVDGVMLPYQTESKFDGQTGLTITVTSYKLNEKVDDAIFEIPVKK